MRRPGPSAWPSQGRPLHPAFKEFLGEQSDPSLVHGTEEEPRMVRVFTAYSRLE